MAEWACMKCKWPPVEGSLVDLLTPDMKQGTCSNLTCPTRKLRKIKLKSGVRGANYADVVGTTTFRRTNVDAPNPAPG